MRAPERIVTCPMQTSRTNSFATTLFAPRDFKRLKKNFILEFYCVWRFDEFTWVVWTRYWTIWSNRTNWVGAARPTGAQSFRLWARSAVGVLKIVPATRWPWAGRPVVPNTFFPHSIACLDRFRHAAIPFHSKSFRRENKIEKYVLEIKQSVYLPACRKQPGPGCRTLLWWRFFSRLIYSCPTPIRTHY